MSDALPCAVVCGGFDDMRSRDVRFLQEASRLGALHVLLWSDGVCQAVTGEAPKFPLAERLYYLEALRYVSGVSVVEELGRADGLPEVTGVQAGWWVVREGEDSEARRAYCAARGLECCVIKDKELAGFPEESPAGGGQPSGKKKVLVTGCYDWFHTGHIRFFEECAELGDLYVVVGHDANIRLLKGEGHPMFSQDERRYIVGSIRYVKQALISTGDGWMDAEPQVAEVRPDVYAVNEDGDKPIKREFCEKRGLEYVVLKRLPKPGLPRRESTHLRGF
jgi:cytidyltransferase-like protein